MHRLKKYSALLLALLLAMGSLSGCAGAKKSGAPGKSNLETDTKKDTNELVTIKMFANFASAEANEYNKAFFEKLEKENNVKIDLEIPPASNYNEKVQLMLVSGIYPDVVQFNAHNDNNLLNGINNDIFMPITNYVKSAPNLMKYTYPESWETSKLKLDSDIYLIPRTSIVRNDGYIVRQDWMDNVGVKVSEDGSMTLDDFTEMLKRFTENDPDKNGKNDTFGFTPVPSSVGNVYPALEKSFGVFGWQEYNEGSYKYMNPKFSKKTDNYKKSLEYMAMLWKKGYINPDWPLMKGTADQDSMTKGQTGVTAGFAGHVQGRQDATQKINPNAKMTYITGVKGKDGKVMGSSANPGIWGGWAVSKTAKNPDRIVKIFDWMLSDAAWDMIKYGIEGVTYKVENGKKVAADKYVDMKKQGWWASGTVRRNNDSSFFVELTVPDAERNKVEKWIDTSIKTVVFSKDLGYKPPISSDPMFIEADKKLNQNIAKIVLGDLSVDSYDKLLDDWYKNGGEKYLQEMNDYIKGKESK